MKHKLPNEFTKFYEPLSRDRSVSQSVAERSFFTDLTWLIKKTSRVIIKLSRNVRSFEEAVTTQKPRVVLLLKKLNKPRTIRIGKTKLIIGLLVAFILWPGRPHVIYAIPDAPAVPVASVKLTAYDSIPQTKLQPQDEAVVVVIAAPTVVSAVSSSITPTPVAGDCSTWIAEAGITETTSVDNIIAAESSCNPYALNASGACGIGQLIGGCDTYDPVQQLIEMNAYVISRYGTWDNAWVFHLANGWY